MPSESPTVRFGEFELDASNFELRRQGRKVRLERKPMDLLILLATRPGQVVLRSEIVSRLWGPDVFVDTDLAVNTAIGKVRRALRDSADEPRFIETVAGRGYRFISRADTSELQPPRGSPRGVRLAVLPFANLGGGPEREYVADGFTEEAIAALGQIDPARLRVISRSSVERFKRSERPLAEIGRKLDASHVLESSMRAEGERYRITCKLIALPEEIQLWSISYDSEPSSMLTFQRELCRAVAEQIRLRVAPERMAALDARRSRNVEAYDLYLRGRHFWNQLTPATTRQAVESYRRATQLDTTFALAWSGLADAYSSSPITSDVAPRLVWPQASEAAANAAGAGADLAEAHTSVGFLNYFLNWNWPAAEAAYRRAVSSDPSYALAHRMLSVVLSYMSRHDEAAASMRRARELDPLYAMHHALSAQTAFLAGDHPAAREFARQAVILGPEFWIGYLQMAQALERMGQYDEALAALATGERFNKNSKMMSLRGYILARLGHAEQAREILAAFESAADQRYVPPYASALIHAGLGEREPLYERLDQAFDARDVHLIYLPVDPKWDPYRSDARFDALVRRCGFMADERGDSD